MIKNDLIYLCIFHENVHKNYIKLLHMHLYISFTNFTANLIEPIKSYSTLIFEETESKLLDYSLDNTDIQREEFVHFKIYEVFFLKHMIKHFEHVFQYIIKKEEMYLSYIKFKNMYIVDLSTGDIIFDMLSLRKSNKNKKIYKNEKLWQELIYHSNLLMENYNREFESGNHDNRDSVYRFVRVECTSTYPRLTFIVKFIPILKGISIIHMYSQNKLSRVSDNNETIIKDKAYKEIDLLCGLDVRNNTNVEFRYSEPKRLQEIEKFLIEFYICVHQNMDAYYNMEHVLKYVDFTAIKSIYEVLSFNKRETGLYYKTTIDSLVTQIKEGLFGVYSTIKNIQEESPKRRESENEEENISTFLIINKDNMYKELFQYRVMESMQNNCGNISRIEGNTSSDDYEVKYRNDDDGWAVRTGIKFKTDIEMFKTNEKQKLEKLDTINLSRLSNTPFDSSVNYSRKISLNNENGFESDSFIERKSPSIRRRNSEHSFAQALDYYLGELNPNSKNNLIIENNSIPKHNVFGTLIKNTTKAMTRKTTLNYNMKQNSIMKKQDTQNKLTNQIENKPISEYLVQNTEKDKRLTRKDTSPVVANNRLSFFDLIEKKLSEERIKLEAKKIEVKSKNNKFMVDDENESEDLSDYGLNFYNNNKVVNTNYPQTDKQRNGYISENSNDRLSNGG